METVLNQPITYVLGIVTVAVLTMISILLLLPKLVRRGVDVSGIIDKVNITLTALDTVTDLVKQLFPGAPVSILDTVIGYASTAVQAAEQLYKTSQIEGDARKAEATALVYKFLQTAGVELDDEMKAIVDGAIEAAVYALPKTHEGDADPTLPDASDGQKESGQRTE